MKQRLALAVVLTLSLSSAGLLAQDTDHPPPAAHKPPVPSIPLPGPGDTVPSWAFGTLFGVSAALGAVMAGVIKSLYTRATTDREAAILTVHKERDASLTAKDRECEQEKTALRSSWESERAALKTASESALAGTRLSSEVEKTELRRQVDIWRLAAEASEKGRREDMERFRTDDRETLKAVMGNTHEITGALRDNTREMKAMIHGSIEDNRRTT